MNLRTFGGKSLQGGRKRLPNSHLVGMNSVLVGMSCSSLPNLVGMAYLLANSCFYQLHHLPCHVDCGSIKKRNIIQLSAIETSDNMIYTGETSDIRRGEVETKKKNQ